MRDLRGPGSPLRARTRTGPPTRYRWIDVTEIPLVGGDLTVGMHVASEEQQLDLVLGEVHIDERKWTAVERQVPGREPRVLPLVRHRDHVAGEHVEPGHVAHGIRRGARIPGVDPMLAQPAMHVVLVVLLAPEQACQSLAHHHRAVGAQRVGDHVFIELVGLGAPGPHHPVNPAPSGSLSAGTPRVSRSRIAALSPGSSSSTWSAATLVPVLAGLTASAIPWTT